MEHPAFTNHRKVLVGFKCSPTLKLTLCDEAKKLDVTLSSYVETIAENHWSERNEIQNLTIEVNQLRESLSFYESGFLNDLFQRHRGETISYTNKEDQTVTITIENIHNVYEVVINSFKTKK